MPVEYPELALKPLHQTLAVLGAPFASKLHHPTLYLAQLNIVAFVVELEQARAQVSGSGGGVLCHTDPDRYWNWNKYMRLIEYYWNRL
jgi:hypothetical protein